jgi:uncharacterized protein (TIGR00369 family)
MMTAPETETPADFTPSQRSSALLDTLGPIFERGTGADYRIGLRVDRRHINNKGFCHGALLAMLADVHLGRLCGLSVDPRPVLVTAGLTLAYLSAAKLGEWLEATGQVDRMGRSLAYATGMVLADGRPALRATGTFQVMTART